jgi:hypothetical protein
MRVVLTHQVAFMGLEPSRPGDGWSEELVSTRVAAMWTFSQSNTLVSIPVLPVLTLKLGQPPSSPSTLLSHSVIAAGSAPILGVL